MKMQLLEHAQRLIVQERLELVAAIWNTVAERSHTNTLLLTAAQRTELDPRLVNLATSPVVGSPCEESPGR